MTFLPVSTISTQCVPSIACRLYPPSPLLAVLPHHCRLYAPSHLCGACIEYSVDYIHPGGLLLRALFMVAVCPCSLHCFLCPFFFLFILGFAFAFWSRLSLCFLANTFAFSFNLSFLLNPPDWWVLNYLQFSSFFKQKFLFST